MRVALSRGALPLCLVLAALSMRAQAEETAPTPPAPAGDPAQWVAKLNSDDFDERNTALDTLARMGEAARAALEKAASGADPDIKAAASELLGKLSQATLSVVALNRDGKPLPDVNGDITVYKDYSNGNQQPKSITTAADGTALITKGEPGIVNLYMNWKKVSHAGTNYVSRLRLLPGNNRFTAQLTVGGSCEAHALDAAGKPLKDAKLFLCPTVQVIDFEDPQFSTRYGRPELTQMTDEKGVAKFENIGDGVYRAIWTHDTCEPTLGPVVRITEGQLTKVPDITLPTKARASVQLTLLKDDGKPLEKTHFFLSYVPVSDDPAVLRKTLKAEYQQHMNNNGQPTQQTDEKGKVTLENIKPGKVHVWIRTTNGEMQGRIFFRGNGSDQTENMVEYAAHDLDLKPGAPTELTLKPAPGGSLKGKVVNDKGEPHRDLTLAVVREDYLLITGTQVFLQNYYDPAGMYTRYAQNKQDGTFEFSHLRPGKYALSVHGRNGEQAIVYGLEVTEGNALDVPEIKLPAPKKAFGEIKGKVLLANAAPGANATVYLETVSANSRSSSGINTNNKGEFNFNLNYYNAGYAPNRLKVSLNGYRPVTLDLTAPDVKPDDLVINLIKRDYGKLCVKTVDEAGKPLPGVHVWPMPSNRNMYYFGRQSVSRMQRTNAAGEAHFSGLADGPRQLQIEFDGYFWDPDPTVNIPGGDEEKVYTAVMHTGLKIAGHLELPEGVASNTASVILADHTGSSTWSTVNADGSFNFSGLAPGHYTITPDVPGCGSTDISPRLTLAKDQKDPLPVQLKVVRNGGVALNLGAANAGQLVHLYKEEFFSVKGDHLAEFWSHNAQNDTVDGNGRTQLIAPLGTYRVLVSEIDNNFGEYAWNRVSVMRSAGTATLQPLKSHTDVGTLEAKEVKPAEGTGSLSFTLKPQFPAGIAKERLVRPFTFVLMGADAVGSFYYNVQQYQQQHPGGNTPLIIGTPPKELSETGQLNSDTYTAEHLPPGEYQLFELIGNNAGENTVVGNKPLTHFTIKDGQKLDGGEIKFEIPAPTKEELDQAPPDYFNYDGTEEDKVELFKP